MAAGSLTMVSISSSSSSSSKSDAATSGSERGLGCSPLTTRRVVLASVEESASSA